MGREAKMVVELKPTEVKTENGKKKDWADFVPVSTPEARKKTAVVGCGTFVAIVVLVAIVFVGLSVGGYFVGEQFFTDDSTEARFHCETKRCRDAYDSEYLHGRQYCEEADHVDKVYEDWLDLVNGEDVQFTEYIRENSGVYHLEVMPMCDATQPTFIIVDTNKGHSVVKAERKRGEGYTCMLFQNEDFMSAEMLHNIEMFAYDSDMDEYDFAVDQITSSFFNFDRPVSSHEREALSDDVNAMCGDGEVGFYHMRKSDYEFRQRIQELMDQHDVEYDDVFDFFTDIYVALQDDDYDELSDLMEEYWEIVGFLPSGEYSDISHTGKGWSLNINVDSWYAYDFDSAEYVPVTQHETEFTWWDDELIDGGRGDRIEDDDGDDDERRDRGRGGGRDGDRGGGRGGGRGRGGD